MSTQSENVQKAITAAEALATAGKLQPVQANAFIDRVYDLTSIKGVRTERFRNERMEIDKIGVGKRVAMAFTEAQDPQKRRGVSHSKIEILPAHFTVPIEISEKYISHNIEGEGAVAHILEMFANKLANDKEELWMNGNKLGPAAIAGDLFPGMSTTGYIKDEFLALQDGWSQLAEAGHIVDAAGANISPTIFGQATRALPVKYRRRKNMMRFLMPDDLESLYNEKISARNDNAGVAALAGGAAGSFGLKRQPVALWEMGPLVVENATMTATDAQQLANTNITDVVVTKSDLAGVPSAAYALTSDYTLDLALGQITRNGAGAIADGEVVKVTYRAKPQMLFTELSNLIIGVNLDIDIKRGMDPYKNTEAYVMHIRAGVQIEEPDAIVKVKNLGTA